MKLFLRSASLLNESERLHWTDTSGNPFALSSDIDSQNMENCVSVSIPPMLHLHVNDVETEIILFIHTYH